jgi:ribosomal protein S18 acetylase RimI-like enzyme
VTARSTPPAQVGPLSAASLTPAQEALGRAFESDPLFVYLVPEERHRARFLRWYAGRILRLGQRAGAVDVAAVAPAPPTGAAVWLRPGQTALPLRALVRARLLPELPLRLGLTGFARFVRFSRAAEGIHRRTIPRPHWYLLLLGAAPVQQRRGLGSALVRAGLDRAAGLPCYLETLNEADLPFYHRHGFTVAAVGAVPRGGPPLWALIRAGLGVASG